MMTSSFRYHVATEQLIEEVIFRKSNFNLRAKRKSVLGFHTAIIGSLKIITKENAHHFIKALVMGHSVQQSHTKM